MTYAGFERLYTAVVASALLAVGFGTPALADWRDLARSAANGAVREAIDHVQSRVGGSRRSDRQSYDAPPSDFGSGSDVPGHSYTRRAPSTPQLEHESSAEQARRYYDTSSGGDRGATPSYDSSTGVRVGGYQNLQRNKPGMSPFDRRAQETESWQTSPRSRAYHPPPTPPPTYDREEPADRPGETKYRYSTAPRPVHIGKVTKRANVDPVSDSKSERLVLPGFPAGGLIVKED